MTKHNRAQQQPIAVVGAGALIPGATGTAGFWRTVVAGDDQVTGVPPGHWLIEDYYDPDPSTPDKTYGRRGAFLPPVEFDPLAYGIPPNTLPATDTTQLLSLLVADQVLKDVGRGNPDALDRERVSVILGTAPLDLLATMANRLQRPVWLKSLRENGIEEAQAQAICDRIADHYVPWQEASFPGLLSNVVAGRIANRFDLHGTNCTTDAACASSLAAVSHAMSELALGNADMVLTGGVDTLNDIVMYMCFSKTPALSATGDCRPFSDRADGTVLGEGLVMVALKRLADAERDGDPIYAVIKGIGTSSDGRSTAIYAPLPEGQARALRRAYEAAGYGPETVGLVEAHGTGTKAGDLAEFTALSEVFGESSRTGEPWCALGSIKSQIGHTKSAAGAAGLLKAVLAVHHKVLPPTIKVDRPNPGFDLASGPLYVNTEARPWIAAPGEPRRASVSSFGFGGSNFHLTLEEYVPAGNNAAADRMRTAASELVLLSADSPAELTAQAHGLSVHDGLSTVARRSQDEFRNEAHARLAVVATDAADLTAKLERAAEAIGKAPEIAFSFPAGISYASGTPEPGEVAFLFPGQGSQYVGMGAGLAMEFDAARQAWDTAAGVDLGDRTLDAVVFPRPVFSEEEREAQEATLTRTEWAQPALAVQSVAQLKMLAALGISPDRLGGHSFGELVALHVAGAYDENTLIRLARKRGELMSEAAASVAGVMLAVKATREDVEGVLAEVACPLWIANHNAPEQVVVSGSEEAVAQAERAFRDRRIAAKRLNAATAFHSPLVAAASKPLLGFLNREAIAAPQIPVYSNADVGVYPGSPDVVRARIAEHLGRPVRFAEQIETMYADGARTFVEVGAGATLTGLVGQILGDRPHLAVSLDRKGRHGVTSLHEALGRLAVSGLAIDFAGLWAGFPLEKETSVPSKPKMTTTLTGTNYGKPYPPAAGAAGLPAPVTSAPAAPVQDEWLRAFQETQRQTAEAHAEYQRVMAESHLAYLRLTESSLTGLTPGAPLPSPVLTPAPEMMPLPPAYPEPVHNDHVLPPAVDVESVLLAVVGEKTGYPVEMLDAGMELEGDLGIDSIKRVEILSGLRERVPGLPEVNAAEMGKLRTLGEILGRLHDAPAPVAETPVVNVESVLLAVVGEKTGYPVEMLDAGMELEGDLGIDSIKRVEILSGLRERVPGLPEVNAGELGKLRTLGEIVGKLRDTGASAPTPEPEPEIDEVPLSRTVPAAVAAPASGQPLPGLGARLLMVTDDGTGVAPLVAARLAECGIDAIVVDEVPADAGSVLFLGGLARASAPEEAIAVNHAAFRAARAFAPTANEHGGVFVTVQDTGGDFGLGGSERAWLGGLAALTRTAAREWPRATTKAIDLERGDRTPEEIAEALVAELLEGGTTAEVGLPADGSRITLKDAPTPAGTGAHEIGPDSVIVATGGARGVTAAALTELARTYRPRIVLIGRTSLTVGDPGLDESALKKALAEKARGEGRKPRLAEIAAEVAAILAAREVRGTIAALEQAGSPVRYLALDARNQSEVADALAEVRDEWGPITGIVHAAGVLADKSIVDKTDEQFSRVFDTKIDGLRALLAATADDPLSLLCVFSSVAARFGNAGQSDYAMANEVLGQVAAAEAVRRPGCRVKAIAWGPWAGGMVDPALAGHFRARGVPMISLEAGARAFVAELADPGPVPVVISAGDPTAFGALSRESDRDENTAHFYVKVGAATHPYLADHDIAGTPVVPVALALEWFATVDPGPLKDVTVLRKIALARFAEGHDLRVTKSGETLELAGDHVHYRATVDGEPPAGRTWRVPSDLKPLNMTGIYDGTVLFHGPAFQAIRSVKGISASGAAALVSGARELGWPGGPWKTDPALVDAGLQLALLWAEQVLGGASLPMSIGRFQVLRPGLSDGHARCVVLAREVHESRAVCDIGLLGADGEPVAELIGVSLVKRPETA